MEAIVGVPNLGDMPEPARVVFEALRSDSDEQMILADNLFIEQMPPGAVLRTLARSTRRGAYPQTRPRALAYSSRCACSSARPRASRERTVPIGQPIAAAASS